MVHWFGKHWGAWCPVLEPFWCSVARFGRLILGHFGAAVLSPIWVHGSVVEPIFLRAALPFGAQPRFGTHFGAISHGAQFGVYPSPCIKIIQNCSAPCTEMQPFLVHSAAFWALFLHAAPVWPFLRCAVLGVILVQSAPFWASFW